MSDQILQGLALGALAMLALWLIVIQVSHRRRPRHKGTHVMPVSMEPGYNPPSASMNPNATVAPIADDELG